MLLQHQSVKKKPPAKQQQSINKKEASYDVNSKRGDKTKPARIETPQIP